jgi:hypothetical protein
MLNKVRRMISKLFDTHDYLIDTISTYDARKFQSILNLEERYTNSSLQFLSQLLTKHHGSPCIVLIDEYDAPLECAYTNDSDDKTDEGYKFLINAKLFFGVLFSSLLKVHDFF